ncbi:cupin domain-containing protein [Nocardia panacis]|uniref:Cupin domain-containing protein n=1 Tax=Nocardia panacis TaxID=2340916 RepID=A0A3A4KM97_9NOCA|nr:cupin domain-containing protein [Nocardia panacis]RJO70656.1 cupin domain-containing protein [Nocardia panacis]
MSKRSVIISTLGVPSQVYGMHGGAGRAEYAVHARRSQFFGPWEAFEWSLLPPGGVCGEHLHTRTEEIYFILSGSGDMVLNGEIRDVRAGDVIFTCVGASHELRNTHDNDLTWLVIELLSPATAKVFDEVHLDDSHRSDSKGTAGVGMTEVISLREPGIIDELPLSGPMRSVGRHLLADGDSLTLRTTDHEYAVYVLSGVGTVEFGANTIVVEKDTAISLPLGENAEFRSLGEPFELFVASMAVPQRTGAAA